MNRAQIGSSLNFNCFEIELHYEYNFGTRTHSITQCNRFLQCALQIIRCTFSSSRYFDDE